MTDQPHKNKIRILVFCLVALTIGYFFGAMGGSGHDRHDHDAATDSAATQKETVWTCSMHPQVEQPEFGQCPICFMDLIPKDDDGGDDEPRTLVISESARVLAELETAVVAYSQATKTLELAGNIVLDETRTRTVTAWVEGRIDELFVNYSGMPVTRHDHVAKIYSPSLISAHQELLQAKNRPELLAAARRRLLRWGVLPDQLALMEKAETPFEHLTIHAPISGIVVDRYVNEGEYVSEGTKMFKIADLNSLWLVVSAFENDSYWLRYGQTVYFNVNAYPGETFSGRVSFVAPVLDTDTRTIPVRVNIDNADGRLKPGMFARARLQITVNSDGTASFPDLAGKWVSPMHPEIIKDAPGSCDVCGMALVPAEQISPPVKLSKPLLVPESAPLWSGRRSVVYRQVGDQQGSYQGVDVILGPRVDGHYIVLSGLNEGDRVVVNGNFKLDAELQLRGRPSMMLPGEHDPQEDIIPAHAHEMHDRLALSPANSAIYAQLVASLMELSRHLSEDEHSAAKTAATAAIDAISGFSFNHEEDNAWKEVAEKLVPALEAMVKSENINTAREHLEQVTAALGQAFAIFGQPLDEAVYLMSCPMAFNNRGAAWYQLPQSLANPYFGARMYRCGVTEATIKPE